MTLSTTNTSLKGMIKDCLDHFSKICPLCFTDNSENLRINGHLHFKQTNPQTNKLPNLVDRTIRITLINFTASGRQFVTNFSATYPPVKKKNEIQKKLLLTK